MNLKIDTLKKKKKANPETQQMVLDGGRSSDVNG